MKKIRGFTLIELLVVIAIVAVLSVIGVVVFKAVTNSARDAQRKADLDSISKAYEIKYSSSGSYPALYTTDFATGRIPKTPEGNNYPCIIGPDPSCVTQATDKVAYCVSLGDNQSAPCYVSSNSCYCTTSTQGASPITGGVASKTSCDPYADLSSGLAGYWKMDEGTWVNDCSTSTVIDSSGNSNNGKSCPSAAGTQPAVGKFGNAGIFDGSNDNVLIPNSSSLTLSQDLTISAWIKTNNAPAEQGIFWKIGTTPTNPDYLFELYGSKLNYQVGGAWASGRTALSNSTWYQVAIVHQAGGASTYYLNGVPDGTSTAGNAITSTRDFQIGAESTCCIFNGAIDDVRVYNRALSASEVSNLYNSGNGCVP